MDEKTPINSFSPTPDPIKFSSPFSPPDQSKSETAKAPLDSLPKTDPVKDIAASLKTDSSAGLPKEKGGVDSIISDAPSAEKKSSKGLFVAITVILVIAAAIITGAIVYFWQSSAITPLQKEKSQLQAQLGNMKSQLDVLQKENTDLQTQLDTARTASVTAPSSETTPAGTPPTPAAPGTETPAPTAPTPPTAPPTQAPAPPAPPIPGQ